MMMHKALVILRIAASFWGGLLILLTGCQSSTPASAPASNSDLTPTPTAQVVAVSTTTPTPTPTPINTRAPRITPTPSVIPMPIPTPAHGPFVYHTVTSGQTLGYIALLYDTPLEELVEMNDLDGPAAIIQVDQQLRVPVQTDEIAPGKSLLPDSEVVFGPAYVEFDIAEFIDEKAGYLANYEEYVDNELMSGAEIVERVAVQFSVGPRPLLALLEYYGEWVTNPAPPDSKIRNPLGPRNPRGGSLYRGLAFTANRINAGYYGYKRDGFWIFYLRDGSQAISAEGSNAGTIGMQNILAIHSDWDTWQSELKGSGLMDTYRDLFDDPFIYDTGPVIPIDLEQPPLVLPWLEGIGFYFTSGPHGGYVDGSAWAAVDFGPPDVLASCFYSSEPTTAVADGVVVEARQGAIYLDLDKDAKLQTGWILFYLHIALDQDMPLQPGQTVQQGDVIGYASCEGGLSNSSHIHLARRYNGEWMAAGGPVPMNMGGWVVQPNLVPYEGNIANGEQQREACECWKPELNLIVNEP
jgi:LasA protease